MTMRKVFLLIPVLVLISIIPLSLAQNHDSGELEECRDNKIIIYMPSNPTHLVCTSPETAERWVELGIGVIKGQENNTDTIIESEAEPMFELEIAPESILEIPEDFPQPEIPVIGFNNTAGVDSCDYDKKELLIQLFLEGLISDVEFDQILTELGCDPEDASQVETLIETTDKPTIGFNTTTEVLTNSQGSVTSQPEPVIEEPEIVKQEVPQSTKQSNKNPLPGTPRKVGSQGIQAFGNLILEVYDKDGKLKHRHADPNLVVTVGLETLSDYAFGTTHVSGESVGGFSYISVGTGGTSPVAGNTDCETQLGSKKQDLSITNTALGAIINVSWIAELPGGTLQEICLTDNASPATGNLFSRQTFAGVPILGTDTVNAEWTITFADSDGS